VDLRWWQVNDESAESRLGNRRWPSRSCRGGTSHERAANTKVYVPVLESTDQDRIKVLCYDFRLLGTLLRTHKTGDNLTRANIGPIFRQRISKPRGTQDAMQ